MRHSEETKRKLSEMRRGAANPFYGRTHTPEAKARIGAKSRQYNLATRRYSISPVSVRVPTGETLGYLAGMIDGDGSITQVNGRPTIVIYQSGDALIHWLVSTVGGRARFGADKRGRTPGNVWTVSAARDVYALCDALVPFLIVKKSNAVEATRRLQDKYGQKLLD